MCIYDFFAKIKDNNHKLHTVKIKDKINVVSYDISGYEKYKNSLGYLKVYWNTTSEVLKKTFNFFGIKADTSGQKRK